MLTLSHSVAGAAIGSLVANVPGAPVVAFGLGVASHYLLDKVPHWENWLGVNIHGFPSGTPLDKLPNTTIIGGVVDVILTVTAFTLLYRQIGHGPVLASPIFWGAFGGFFPDFLDNVPILDRLTIRLPGVAAERNFHSVNHISDQARRRVPYITGLLTQLVTIVIGIALLLR